MVGGESMEVGRASRDTNVLHHSAAANHHCVRDTNMREGRQAGRKGGGHMGHKRRLAPRRSSKEGEIHNAGKRTNALVYV